MPKSCKGNSPLSQQIHFPVYKNCMHVCKQQYNLWLKPQKGKKYLKKITEDYITIIHKETVKLMNSKDK